MRTAVKKTYWFAALALALPMLAATPFAEAGPRDHDGRDARRHVNEYENDAQVRRHRRVAKRAAPKHRVPAVAVCAPPKSPQQIKYERGSAAGRQDGRTAGYADGYAGRVACGMPHEPLHRRSRPFRRGYLAGYEVTYAKAFARGQAERRRITGRQRRPRWPSRPNWTISFRW